MAAAGTAARSIEANARDNVAGCFMAALLELRGLRRGALRCRPSRALSVAVRKGDAMRARTEAAATGGATAAPSGVPPDLSGGTPGMVYAIGSFVWHIVQNAPNQGSASGARCAARWTIHPSQVPVLGEAR